MKEKKKLQVISKEPKDNKEKADAEAKITEIDNEIEEITATKKIKEDLSKERLDKACALIFEDYSRSQLKKWIIEGRVLLNNEIASPKEIVTTDDEISLNPIFEKIIQWQPENIDFEIIHEDEHFLIINKPSK